MLYIDMSWPSDQFSRFRLQFDHLVGSWISIKWTRFACMVVHFGIRSTRKVLWQTCTWTLFELWMDYEISYFFRGGAQNFSKQCFFFSRWGRAIFIEYVTLMSVSFAWFSLHDSSCEGFFLATVPSAKLGFPLLSRSFSVYVPPPSKIQWPIQSRQQQRKI